MAHTLPRVDKMPAVHAVQVFAGGREGLLERLFPRLQYIKAICTGSMAKFVPLLRQLVPTLPLLSMCYGATEGVFGVAAELVEFTELAACCDQNVWQPAGSGGKQPQQPQQPHASADTLLPATAAAGCEAPAAPAAAASSGQQMPQSPCSVLEGVVAREGQERPSLSFREFSKEAPDQASYILCPDANCYLEFLPLSEGGEPAPSAHKLLR
jgi:hypothetical protein